MPIFESDDGTLCAQPGTNELCVALVEPDGEVKIIKTAIVSQYGEFFIVCQKMYHFWLYWDGQTVVCYPATAKKWPAMAAFLDDKVDIKQLAPVSACQPEPEVTAEGLSGLTGRVVYFDVASGAGLIVTPEGEAKVHWSKIVPVRGGRRYLLPGEVVRCNLLRQVEPGTSRTTCPFEAIGVDLAH